MNAFNTVNLAAAAIVTTVEHAERLKIPREKWVYVLGGAGARETEDCETTYLNQCDRVPTANRILISSLGTPMLLS